MRMILGFTMCGVVAACSGGAPSESDIQQALQALEQRSQIEAVEQVECADASEGRYRCSFKVTARSGKWVRDREMSRLFEKRPSGWAVAGE